jgi:acetyl-CoA acetyltransferase
MKIDEFDAIGCNEAFAAVALMWAKEFRPVPEKSGVRDCGAC